MSSDHQHDVSLPYIDIDGHVLGRGSFALDFGQPIEHGCVS